MDAASDFELLSAWGLGDQDAGTALYQRYFPSLYRFFRNKADDAVSDLVQSTFLACVEGRERFRREASFRTYLFKAARFQLALHYRRLKRHPSVDFSVVTAADLCATPSELIATRQDQRLLLEALRRIPIDQQIVLELSFWHDMSGPEIAEVLGAGDATIRSRLSRAAQRLKLEMHTLSGGGQVLQETEDDLAQWATRIRALATGAP